MNMNCFNQLPAVSNDYSSLKHTCHIIPLRNFYHNNITTAFFQNFPSYIYLRARISHACACRCAVAGPGAGRGLNFTPMQPYQLRLVQTPSGNGMHDQGIRVRLPSLRPRWAWWNFKWLGEAHRQWFYDDGWDAHAQTYFCFLTSVHSDNRTQIFIWQLWSTTPTRRNACQYRPCRQFLCYNYTDLRKF